MSIIGLFCLGATWHIEKFQIKEIDEILQKYDSAYTFYWNARNEYWHAKLSLRTLTESTKKIDSIQYVIEFSELVVAEENLMFSLKLLSVETNNTAARTLNDSRVSYIETELDSAMLEFELPNTPKRHFNNIKSLYNQIVFEASVLNYDKNQQQYRNISSLKMNEYNQQKNRLYIQQMILIVLGTLLIYSYRIKSYIANHKAPQKNSYLTDIDIHRITEATKHANKSK